MSREVVLAFLPADSSLLQRSYLNWAAARIAPSRQKKRYGAPGQAPMVHAEIWLKENDNDGFAASICYNKTCHYDRKRFSRKTWSFRSIYVSKAQFKKLQLFFSAHKGCKFNKVGFFALGLAGLRISGKWPERLGWRPRFWCSELIVTGLKAVGYFEKSGPGAISTQCHPEELFQFVGIISSASTIRDWAQDEVAY